MTKSEPIVSQFHINTRRDLCLRLEEAQKGHPKPELVKQLLAQIDAFDKRHPRVRGAR